MSPWGAWLGLLALVIVGELLEHRKAMREQDRPSSLRRALTALAGLQHTRREGG